MSRCSRLCCAHACLLQQPSEYHRLAIRGRPDASRSHLRELRRRDQVRRQTRPARALGYRVRPVPPSFHSSSSRLISIVNARLADRKSMRCALIIAFHSAFIGLQLTWDALALAAAVVLEIARHSHRLCHRHARLARERLRKGSSLHPLTRSHELPRSRSHPFHICSGSRKCARSADRKFRCCSLAAKPILQKP